jgi:hypothetical protein
MSSRRVLITGASKGIGYALAERPPPRHDRQRGAVLVSCVRGRTWMHPSACSGFRSAAWARNRVFAEIGKAPRHDDARPFRFRAGFGRVYGKRRPISTASVRRCVIAGIWSDRARPGGPDLDAIPTHAPSRDS